ncbi:MAG: DUF2309 domain-containing protein [Aquificae bacterium]|nr:DUF2309 domain-containing protein [Aquificota bacterium]
MKFNDAQRVKIRTLVNTMGERIPFFWPMRNFIHHNPLYGLEDLRFEEALKWGKRLFHGRTLPPREHFVKLFKEGEIEERFLDDELRSYLREKDAEAFFSLFKTYLLEPSLRPYRNAFLEPDERLLSYARRKNSVEAFVEAFERKLGRELGLDEAADRLFGTHLKERTEEELIRACALFLDEGQSVLGMPFREEGFFNAWKRVFRPETEEAIAEEAIFNALNELGIKDEFVDEFVTFELARLHGWSGFIRWRSSAKEYYWQRKHPANLVDFLAIKLLLFIDYAREAGVPYSFNEILSFVKERPLEALIRYDFFTGELVPELWEEVEEALKGRRGWPEGYAELKARAWAGSRRAFLEELFRRAGEVYDAEKAVRFLELLEGFEEGLVWLRAHERSLISRLVSSVRVKEERRKPFAQALFCIDVRSERFRRHLEALGEYETYGIAGFFGVPISFIELGKGHETYLCPVLIKPKNVVVEVEHELPKEEGDSFKEVLKEVLHDLKNNVLTPYVTVEAVGLLFGLEMIGKTFFPLQYARLKGFGRGERPSKLIVDKLKREEAEELIRVFEREVVARALERELKVKNARSNKELVEAVRRAALEELDEQELVRLLGRSEEEVRRFLKKLRDEYKVEKGYERLWLEKLAKIGFTLEEQVAYVEKALKMIGLTEGFARFVLVVGHGSSSDNNPYESALDCGACGGDHGLVNARVFCAMANKKEVREKLRERGISIPDETVFIPAEHDTTTDEVRFYDLHYLSPAGMKLFEKVVKDFEEAGKKTAYERCKELPVCSCRDEEEAKREVLRNAVDWTQVRPEWGLSGNWAFVVGRRSLTEELNLEGKVFLHSYDYRIDPKGFLLENVLSGPMVVGEWINLEHFFSAADNEGFGSGSKVYHNVVGRFGVMTGNWSDLRTGLPSQTVLRGKERFHRPVRLIVLIEAPKELVERVIKRVWKVRELVLNGWVRLLVLDPIEKRFYAFGPDGWEVLDEGA